MNWNKLSVKEKAAYIKVGIANGLSNVEDVKKYYNSFEGGGSLDKQKQIEDINIWALNNPDRILGDDFKQQRQYLSEDSWNTLYNNNPELFNIKDINKLPTNIQKQVYNNNIKTTTRAHKGTYSKGLTKGFKYGGYLK